MNAKDDQSLIQHCTDLYQQTHALWRSLEGQYPTWECRFSILYGPPIRRPDLLILGSNPGFNAEDLYDEEVLTWPGANEYLARDWPLAVRLRSLFEMAGLEDLLARSVGTNRLFFKSKSLARHETGLGWGDNPAAIRQRLEAYCTTECGKLVDALRPSRILVLGLGVFDHVVDAAESQAMGKAGRRIAASGFSGGVRVLGIIHPTGARVSTDEWARLAEWLAGEFAGGLQSTRTFDTPTNPLAEPCKSAPVLDPRAGSRQPPFKPETVVRAARKPPSTFAYQPIHDFWHELVPSDEVSVAEFHAHMLSIGWRRPQGKPLTYEVTRTDIACMCREGFAIRVRG